MQTCPKCGASVPADVAFCRNCGAAQVQVNAPKKEASDWDMAATMVGQKLPMPSRPSQGANQQSAPTAQQQTPPANTTPQTPPAAAVASPQTPINAAPRSTTEPTTKSRKGLYIGISVGVIVALLALLVIAIIVAYLAFNK